MTDDEHFEGKFEDLSASVRFILSTMDYIISDGRVYEIEANDFMDDVYVKEINQVPDEYWESR